MDTTAAAALKAQVIRPIFLVFLDVIGDSLRACTAGHSVAFTGSGDPDIDGHTFDGINPAVVDIGAVRMKEGGSEPVKAKLSGIVGLDEALMNLLGDRANWWGRTARLWRIIRNEAGERQGGIQHYYTGYMVDLEIGGDPSSQTIEMTIESYLAAFSGPSNRTYLDQELYDPGDLSARASIAIANGVSGSPLISNTGMGPSIPEIPDWKF